jgi:hypothetical protein
MSTLRSSTLCLELFENYRVSDGFSAFIYDIS